MSVGMDARRNAKAAKAAGAIEANPAAIPAAITPIKAAAKEPKAPKAPKVKKARITGPLRTLIAMRALVKEANPILESDGAPAKRDIFDIGSRSAKKLTDETPKDKILSFDALVKHLNATVMKDAFGVPFKPRVLKTILQGSFAEILSLVEQDRSVKLTGLATFEKKHRKARKARNPKTGASVNVPARATMVSKVNKMGKIFVGGIATLDD